ncbi:unnamed protein product [Phaedon cochleariae]|uniref:Globin domain-containing protein n=1 Tax=Phaedon cochleariae TaxID=80249 RepID=A0A9P0DTR6_PHACE|nr:unnamed protein product [Phaedon cochleariae]
MALWMWNMVRGWTGHGVDTGRTDDPDTHTGLTSRDKYLIRTSWEIVMKDPTGNGIKLFIRLFEIQPKHQQVFPFRDIPISDLPENKRFQAHCNSIVYSFGSIVSGIDDHELLNSIAEKLGIAHAKRSVDRQALKDVKSALVDTFSFMNQEQLESWSKLLDLAFEQMNMAIENSQK